MKQEQRNKTKGSIEYPSWIQAARNAKPKELQHCERVLHPLQAKQQSQNQTCLVKNTSIYTRLAGD